MICAVVEVRQSVVALQQAKPALMYEPRRLLELEGVYENAALYQDISLRRKAQDLQRHQRSQDLYTFTETRGFDRDVPQDYSGEVLEPTVSQFETATWLYSTTLRPTKAIPSRWSGIDVGEIEDNDHSAKGKSIDESEDESKDRTEEFAVTGAQPNGLDIHSRTAKLTAPGFFSESLPLAKLPSPDALHRLPLLGTAENLLRT
jgi:hypothetical protein